MSQANNDHDALEAVPLQQPGSQSNAVLSPDATSAAAQLNPWAGQHNSQLRAVTVCCPHVLLHCGVQLLLACCISPYCEQSLVGSCQSPDRICQPQVLNCPSASHAARQP
jgi:hypothetical protein